MATERELEKSESLHLANIQFDCSGHFILYPTMIGIKLVNIETNRCIKIIGKGDNVRPLHVALFQGRTKKPKAALSLEQEGSENPILAQTSADPTLFVTAFKYSIVFFCFSLLLSTVFSKSHSINYSFSESQDSTCTAGECHLNCKMLTEMCSMRNHQKKISSLCQRVKVKCHKSINCYRFFFDIFIFHP